MVDFVGVPDQSQEEILSLLEVTERLIERALLQAGAGRASARILGLPDLGVPHNATRVAGGFFTGALYQWDCDIPFVPVDTTVNACGVAVFKVASDSPLVHNFHARVDDARSYWVDEASMRWNFTNGNHFISLCHAADDVWEYGSGHFLLIHASPAEFKAKVSGLYPSKDSWFAHDIDTLVTADGRYIRYLSGSMAERFFAQSEWMARYQLDRQRWIAELLAGPGNVSEVWNRWHYGMPDTQSVAIGAQWVPVNDPRFVLLSSPKKPIYVMDAMPGGVNQVQLGDGEYHLVPHGLGVRSITPLDARMTSSQLSLWGRTIDRNGSLAANRELQMRTLPSREAVAVFLKGVPSRVVAELTQVHSVFRTGGS